MTATSTNFQRQDVVSVERHESIDHAEFVDSKEQAVEASTTTGASTEGCLNKHSVDVMRALSCRN